MIFDLSNALHFSQGFFLPHLVAIGHFWVIWPLFDPAWPLHDLWSHECTTLWSRVLPTKFGCHRAFLSNLTSGWRRLTSAWHLTPAMHYTSVRAFSNQIQWPEDISKATWPLGDLWPLVGSLPYALKPRGPILYPKSSFSPILRSMTDRQTLTHTYPHPPLHTHTHTHRFIYLSSIDRIKT